MPGQIVMSYKEMNIVFYGPVPFPDGYATSKRRLAYIRYFTEMRKIDCKVLVTRHNSFDIFNNPEILNSNHLIYRDLSPVYKKSSLGYLKELFIYIKEYYQKDKKNILVFTTFITMSSLLIIPYSKLLGYKIVFDKTEHISIRKSDAGFLKYFLIRIIDFILVLVADGLIVISTFLLDGYKKNKSKIVLIPNSVVLLSEGFQSSPSSLTRILFSGTFEEKNGPHFLLDAVEKLHEEYENLELNIVGLKDEKFFNIYYEKYRNKDFVHFLGFTDESQLQKLLRESDILTMTRIDSFQSRYGFPYKLSEALASGKPVLCTDVGDVGLYVKHLHDVFLVKPGDSTAIYSGLKQLVENKELCRKLSNNARVAARRYFDVEKNGDNLLMFLEDI